MPGLLNTDNSTNNINCGTGANLQIGTGTFITWLRTDSVANAARDIFANKIGDLGVEAFKRAIDGTVLRIQVGLTTASQTQDSPSNFLVSSVLPYFYVICWDATSTTNGIFYRGNLVTPPVSFSATITSSGTYGASSSAFRLLTTIVPNGGWPGAMYFAGLWNRILTSYEINQVYVNTLFYNGTRTYPPIPQALWWPGKYGASYVRDESGFGNHGIVTGLVPTADNYFNKYRAA